MPEMVGQDANFHAIGAQFGQHGPFQEIKHFLSNKGTPIEDSLMDHHLESSQDDYDNHYYGEQDQCCDDNYAQDDPYNDLCNEKEELITHILQRRLAYLYMAFLPLEPIEGPADTLFIVRRSKECHIGERVLIRAHSLVLKRTNDAFNELIGYRPPMVPSPSNIEEAEKSGMQISWKEEEVYGPSRMSMYLNLIDDNAKEREDNYLKAIYDHQREQDLDNIAKTLEDKQEEKAMKTEKFDINKKIEINKDDNIKDIDDFITQVLPAEILKRQTSFIANDQNEKTIVQRQQGFGIDKQIKLGLENVIGNFQNSMKPSLVNEVLDASLKLIQLPGWNHVPINLKQSFQQLASSLNKLKNINSEALKGSETSTNEVDGKSLESTFLGMVGRGSKDMLNILGNISQGIAERRKSKILLEKEREKELASVPRNIVSATIARTTLEKRKTQAYVENHKRRTHFSPLEKQKSRGVIGNRDKRTSPSFLERRQSKALLEIAKQDSEILREEYIKLQTKTSNAAIVAFERRKRLSVLEAKTMPELEFSGPHDGGLCEVIAKAGPFLQAPGRRVTAMALGLSSGISKNNAMQRASRQAQIPSNIDVDLQSSTKNKSVQFKHEVEVALGQTTPITRMANSRRAKEGLLGRRPSQPPSLNHTRDEGKDEVVKFFEEEDINLYSTSSESSLQDPVPPPLPKDVEFVVEKMHWTCDVLHALMEFIYTETLHIHCEELPDVYRAANEILLSSLTDAIRLKPINQYYRLAMVNDENRRALLDLANQLTTSADFENYVNKNEDFVNLKKLCEAFEFNGKVEKKPYTLLLETGHKSFGNLPFVTPGLHTIGGQMVLILKDPREGTRFFEQNREQEEYLTFTKKLMDKKNHKPITKMNWLGQWPPIEKPRNRDKAWKVYFFDFPNLEQDIPLKNFVFYKHISSLTLAPIGKEEFNVRLICGILICPILYKALHIGFPKLDIMAGRGAGYFLGGGTHGNNITMTGHPLYLLQACKSLPRHLVGRVVLRVACPSEKTFTKLWKSTNRFGVDLEQNALYFLKPLIQIQKMLEYWHEVDLDAKYIVTHPREMVELVEPHDPF